MLASSQHGNAGLAQVNSKPWLLPGKGCICMMHRGSKSWLGSDVVETQIALCLDMKALPLNMRRGFVIALSWRFCAAMVLSRLAGSTVAMAKFCSQAPSVVVARCLLASAVSRSVVCSLDGRAVSLAR